MTNDVPAGLCYDWADDAFVRLRHETDETTVFVTPDGTDEFHEWPTADLDAGRFTPVEPGAIEEPDVYVERYADELANGDIGDDMDTMQRIALRWALRSVDIVPRGED